MNATRQASQEYLKSAVMTARPEQLQLMLLDGAIRFALKGREAVATRNHEQAFVNLDRAQRICLQLGDGLNKDANPQLATQMRALYDFCYRRLVAGNLHRDVQALDDAVRILKHQRETWGLIVEKIAREALGGAGTSARPPGSAGSPASAPPRPAAAPRRAGPLNLLDEDASTVNFEG